MNCYLFLNVVGLCGCLLVGLYSDFCTVTLLLLDLSNLLFCLSLFDLCVYVGFCL